MEVWRDIAGTRIRIEMVPSGGLCPFCGSIVLDGDIHLARDRTTLPVTSRTSCVRIVGLAVSAAAPVKV